MLFFSPCQSGGKRGVGGGLSVLFTDGQILEVLSENALLGVNCFNHLMSA